MPRQGLTPARVVAEAAALADEAGLERVTFAALGSRLGTSAPALYKHVDGLSGLRRELTLLGLKQLGERMSAAAVGKSREDALLAAAQAYRDYAREHPGLVNLVLRAPEPDDARHEAAAIAGMTVMRQVLAGYDLGEEDLVHAVRALRVIMHGFVALEQAGGFGLPESLDETYRRLIAGVHRSLVGQSRRTIDGPQ